MKHLLAVVTCALVFSVVTWADEPRAHLPPKAQKAARIASWVTLGIAYTLDTKASWQSSDRKRAFMYQGLRFGLSNAAVGGLKKYFPRDRPCAPNNCGSDDPHASFCSGHTANAFQTVGGPPAKYAYPLAAATAAGRWLGNLHWPSDLAACAGIGLGLSRLR